MGVSTMTVRVVEPLTVPLVAVIEVAPIQRDVASPVALTLATVALEDDQLLVAVRSCVLPSVKVPVAVSCCVAPRTTDGLAGLIASDTSWGPDTVSRAEAALDPEAAVIVAVPTPALVARPCVPVELLTTATVAALDVHVADVVTS